MEFNISSADLLKGMIDLSKAIPAKTALPILEDFLFVLKDNKLEITASDQELTLRTYIPVDSCAEEGSIAAPARQMIELFKVLPDQPVLIKTTGESSFDCIWSNGNSSLPYHPASDYPSIKGTGENTITISVPSSELAAAIGGTIYATADDEMRPTMNGIFFDIDPESTTLVATDSHKLICFTTGEFKSTAKASFILHKKPAAIIKSIIDKEESEIQISFDENNAIFQFGQTIMVCRLIPGKFPNYRVVIPQNNSNILRIDRAQFLNTVKRVAVCANKASNHIKFDLKASQIEITAQDLGYAIAAYEKLDCEYNGEDLTIGFKSSFLIEILSNMSCETLVMKFADSRRAALLIPSEEEATTEKICGIIMPIMVA